MDKAEVGKAGVGKSTLTLGKHLMFLSTPFPNLFYMSCRFVEKNIFLSEASLT